MNNEERKGIYQYLRSKYAGVFNEQQIERHIEDYIGYKIADQQINQVLQKVGEGSKILDIGSGFGSFVLRARKKGLDAAGIDIANFEVEFARKRLSEERPSDDPEYVYRLGSGLDLPYEPESFDVVTLWNILEHISNYKKLLTKAISVLRPGGYLFIVCPNYASFREEAHYHVSWPSLLPRKLAKHYLRFYGKNPNFFENNIFYRTNWDILYTLKSFGMEIYNVRKEKLIDLTSIKNQRTRKMVSFLKRLHLLWTVKFLVTLSFYNPFKKSVVLYAIKKRNF